MSIRVICQSCGKKMSFAETAAGKMAKCKGCNARLTVPTSTESDDGEPDYDELVATAQKCKTVPSGHKSQTGKNKATLTAPIPVSRNDAVEVSQSPVPGRKYDYDSLNLGRRHAAFGLDVCVWIASTGLGFAFLTMPPLPKDRTVLPPLAEMAMPLAVIFTVPFLIMFSEAIFGVSLGKKLLRLRVLSPDGSQSTRLALCFRAGLKYGYLFILLQVLAAWYLAHSSERFIWSMIICGLLGPILSLAPQSQTFYDYLAGTRVWCFQPKPSEDERLQRVALKWTRFTRYIGAAFIILGGLICFVFPFDLFLNPQHPQSSKPFLTKIGILVVVYCVVGLPTLVGGLLIRRHANRITEWGIEHRNRRSSR